ncbi:MAG: hypothetical protein ACR2OA_07865 [Rubripirellula sp.]|jgi:hypothetical protein
MIVDLTALMAKLIAHQKQRMKLPFVPMHNPENRAHLRLTKPTAAAPPIRTYGVAAAELR